MISFVFAVVLSLGLSVVVLSVPPVIIAGLLVLVVLGALALLYGILSLRAKVEVAKIHAARPAPMPQQAPPVVVVPSRLVLDPVEDGRRWLAQGRGGVVAMDTGDRNLQPPARRPREWRVVND